MARRKRHHDEEHENHERWLISYADFITLLMIFFIIMFAMSSVDKAKFQALKASLGRAIATSYVDAPVTGPDPAKPPEDAAKKPQPSTEQAKAQIKAQLEAELEKAKIKDQVDVVVDSRGVVLLLTDRLLFESGRADILPAGQGLLRQLSPFLVNKSRPIVVEGHTDNRPIATVQFPNNRVLSVMRSCNVLEYLVGTGIPDDRLTAAGYADTHPRVTNTTEGGRATNRRVELIIVVTPESARAGVAAGVPAPDATPGSTTTAGTPAATPAPAAPAVGATAPTQTG